MTTRSTLRPRIADYAHLEPLPDPLREPDMQQDEHIVESRGILKIHYRHRKDMLIAGSGYLRQDMSDDSEEFVPDCIAVGGVNPEGIIARNGYVISEVGKSPDFVLEIASRSTGRRDYTVKREGYARLGVREYWRFDHTGGRFHDAPLAGDLLVDGKYEPIDIHEEAKGLLWGYSAALDLDLCWDDGRLRFRNPATGEFLPTPDEVDDARRIAESERDDAEFERDAAEARATAAEAELVRIREQLRRLQQD